MWQNGIRSISKFDTRIDIASWYCLSGRTWHLAESFNCRGLPTIKPGTIKASGKPILNLFSLKSYSCSLRNWIVKAVFGVRFQILSHWSTLPNRFFETWVAFILHFSWKMFWDIIFEATTSSITSFWTFCTKRVFQFRQKRRVGSYSNMQSLKTNTHTVKNSRIEFVSYELQTV